MLTGEDIRGHGNGSFVLGIVPAILPGVCDGKEARGGDEALGESHGVDFLVLVL